MTLDERLAAAEAAEREVAAGMDMRPEDTANHDYAEAISAARRRIAELERTLRLVRDQISDDHETNLPTERAAQSLILADIDIALAGAR